jgi:RNA polymerase sigma-70 factor (ECF subfamily)
MFAQAARRTTGGTVSGEPGGPARETPEGALARARRGDQGGFGALFESYREDVGRLCARMLGAGPDAEDARSETFLRAQRAFAGYDARQPFRRWLLAVAAHHCIDVLRRRGVEGRLFEPGELEDGALAGPGPSPLRAALRLEERRRVHAALAALPARDRVPLVLRHLAELSYAEIAELTGVPRERIGTLLTRARQRLRARLAEEDAGDGAPEAEEPS